jgi:alpha-glucosidase
MLHHDDALLIFERRLETRAWLCVFNLSQGPRRYALATAGELITDVPGSMVKSIDGTLHLPAQSFGYVQLPD